MPDTADSGTAGSRRATEDTALCSCHTASLPTPAGEIVVVSVFGDVDLGTVHVLRAALAGARDRRPSHLVVDLTGLGFCSVRGLSLLIDGHDAAAASHTQYLLSGAGPHIERLLTLLRTEDALPRRHPTTGAAVLAAMADQRARHGRVRPTGHPGRRARPVVVGSDRFDGLSDREVIERARAGREDAYRELARRHRTCVYRSALRMLGSGQDPEDRSEHTAQDIAARLRVALAEFGQAGPP